MQVGEVTGLRCENTVDLGRLLMTLGDLNSLMFSAITPYGINAT